MCGLQLKHSHHFAVVGVQCRTYASWEPCLLLLTPRPSTDAPLTEDPEIITIPIQCFTAVLYGHKLPFDTGVCSCLVHGAKMELCWYQVGYNAHSCTRRKRTPLHLRNMCTSVLVSCDGDLCCHGVQIRSTFAARWDQ
jgi:hypothetical protein